jgi:hypothetical protein
VLQLAARVLAPGDEELVVLHRGAVGEVDGEEHVVEKGFPVRAQRSDGRDRYGPDPPALGSEPALLRQPLGQPLGQQLGELLVEVHPVSSAGVMENQ